MGNLTHGDVSGRRRREPNQMTMIEPTISTEDRHLTSIEAFRAAVGRLIYETRTELGFPSQEDLAFDIAGDSGSVGVSKAKLQKAEQGIQGLNGLQIRAIERAFQRQAKARGTEYMLGTIYRRLELADDAYSTVDTILADPKLDRRAAQALVESYLNHVAWLEDKRAKRAARR